MDRPAPNDQLDRAVIAELRAVIAAESLHLVIDTFEAGIPRWTSEISGAVRAGDARALKEAAHALKGASANLGAAYVAQLSARLVELARSGDLDRAPELAEELERAVLDTPSALREELSS